MLGVGCWESELFADIIHNLWRGGGSERQHGNTRQQSSDIGNFQIAGAEVVAPLRDTVCLVYGDEGYLHVAQLSDKEVAAETFGRNIQKLRFAHDAVVEDAQHLVMLQS